MLDTLLNLPKRAVWAFVNEVDRKAWVSPSRNVLRALTHNLALIRDGHHPDEGLNADKLKLTFKVLEDHDATNLDEEQVKLRAVYHMDSFKSLGYTLYRERTPLEYKVRIDLERVFEEQKLFPVVRLVSRNDKERVVGVFLNPQEAELFVKKHYSGPVYDIVLGKNPTSKRYFNLNAI